MNLSETLRQAATHSPTHAAFLRECADKAELLESPLDHQVRAMHRRFGCDAPEAPVQTIHEIDIDHRVMLITEEFSELIGAIEDGYLSEVAQECTDLIYVTVGTLVALGIPLMPFWGAVHRSQMSKAPNPDGGKWVKPEDWEPVDAREILWQARRDAR